MNNSAAVTVNLSRQTVRADRQAAALAQLQQANWKDYGDYISQVPLTRSERYRLCRWVSEGNSVYDAPEYLMAGIPAAYSLSMSDAELPWCSPVKGWNSSRAYDYVRRTGRELDDLWTFLEYYDLDDDAREYLEELRGESLF